MDVFLKIVRVRCHVIFNARLLRGVEGMELIYHQLRFIDTLCCR